MDKKVYGGIFITLSGIDGCGKSTISKILADKYSENFDTMLVDVMGCTKVARDIKKYVLDPNNNLTPNTELLLFTAAIESAIDEVIKPALNDGYFVICDRFVICTHVYQFMTLGADIIPRVSLDSQLDIVLDLPVMQAKERMSARNDNDKMDNYPIEFHQKVRDNYIKYAKELNNAVIVNAGGDIDSVVNKCTKVIDNYVFYGRL